MPRKKLWPISTHSVLTWGIFVSHTLLSTATHAFNSHNCRHILFLFLLARPPSKCSTTIIASFCLHILSAFSTTCSTTTRSIVDVLRRCGHRHIRRVLFRQRPLVRRHELQKVPRQGLGHARRPQQRRSQGRVVGERYELVYPLTPCEPEPRVALTSIN